MIEALEFKNLLLSSLTERDLAAIVAFLEPVPLTKLLSLETANTSIEYLYFPESGIASTVARISPTREIEVGFTGREGVTGTAIILGSVSTPHDCYVQVQGHGHRIPAAQLSRLMVESKSLSASMLSYVNSFVIQVAATAQANAVVKLQNRLARWLLMIHDRADGDTFAITHDFLSIMLGARRPGVTVALQEFEGENWLKAGRGRVTILNRQALIECAGKSYGLPEREYRRLLGAGFSKD